ncbi:MAG: type II secretion system protein J [Wujia sp.]
MKKKTRFRQSNNAGFTMVEMLATFALLALFMVAATRVISYTIGIYYSATGNMKGMQVSSMISAKIVGQLEGASSAADPKVTKGADGIDAISFIDATGSSVTITASEQLRADGSSAGVYMNIAYDAVTEGSIQYDAVDWRFDEKAYLGYTVKTLTFEDPGDAYPDNVIRMTLVLHSGRYGDYTATYYIKCVNASKIIF